MAYAISGNTSTDVEVCMWVSLEKGGTLHIQADDQLLKLRFGHATMHFMGPEAAGTEL